MANLTPLGSVSINLAAIALLVSNLPIWQAWTGTYTSAAAAGSIFIGDTGFPINSVGFSNNVVTITTRDPHNLVSGQSITLEGASLGPQGLNLAGDATITGVPATNSFTFSVYSTEFSGTYTPDFAFVVPCAPPICTIKETPGSYRSASVAVGGVSTVQGQADLYIEGQTSSQYNQDPVNAPVEARNLLFQLADQLRSTQETLDFIPLSSVDIVTGPDWLVMAGQDDNTLRFNRWSALIRVTWGLSQ